MLCIVLSFRITAGSPPHLLSGIRGASYGQAVGRRAAARCVRRCRCVDRRSPAFSLGHPANSDHPFPATLNTARMPAMHVANCSLSSASGIPDRDVEDVFAKYGRLRNCWVARKPPGFGFGELRLSRGLLGAVKTLPRCCVGDMLQWEEWSPMRRARLPRRSAGEHAPSSVSQCQGTTSAAALSATATGAATPTSSACLLRAPPSLLPSNLAPPARHSHPTTPASPRLAPSPPTPRPPLRHHPRHLHPSPSTVAHTT